MIRGLIGAARRAMTRARAAIRSFAGVAPEDIATERVYWDDGVNLALTDLVQEAETRASGRVQVITLADFRAAIGELWDKYEQRILIIAESTISRMIGRGNTYIPQDKDTWLLLFSALSEQDALKRADAIAARIGEKLVGAQFTEVPPPLPQASKLDLNGAINADGTLNLDRLKSAVQNVRQAAAAAPGIAKAVAAKTAAAKAAKSVPRPTAAAPAPAAATPAPAKSEAAQFTISFRPAWTAETQAVDSFFFRANKADGSELYGPGVIPPTGAAVVELLDLATRAFAEMCERGLRATLTVPVPYTSLNSANVAEMQKMIASLPQRERLTYLRLEVTNVPMRAGAETLVPLRELFRSYVRDVAFLLDPFQLAEQALALDHIMAGVDVSRGGRRSDDEILQALLVFRQRAGRRSTYALGLASRLQVSHALTAGIAQIGGPGVAHDLKKLPDQISVIRRQDLLL